MTVSMTRTANHWFSRPSSFLGLAVAAGLVFSLAACGASAAPSQQTNAAIDSPAAQLGGDGSFARIWNDGLRICTINDAIYNHPDSTGKWTGLDSDIVNEALSRLKIQKVSYLEGPWDSMVPSLTSGRCDFLQTNIHSNPERDKIIGFTAPVYFYADALIVQKANPLSVHTWEDMKGRSSSAMLGDNYVDMLNARKDLSAVKTYKTTAELISDVGVGRVDTGILDAIVAGNYIKTHPEANVELATGYVPQSDQADWTRFGVQKGANDLANAFSRVLDEMRVDGTTAKILTTYGVGVQAIQAFRQ